MPGIFRFKQFEVDQAGCSMKINTDGVLLGAMATAEAPRRILDIGTGTGVIALMLAQRFPHATIDAIEIDPEAAETAARNFDRSPFARQLAGYPVGLVDFEPKGSYGLIVSNPPYFLDSLKSPDPRKSTARHTDWAFFDQLLAFANDWLEAAGSLQLVLPVSLAEELCQRAVQAFGLARQWEVDIHSFGGEPAVRRIVSIGKQAMAIAKPPFVIYARRGEYSEAYRALLQDFFLAF